MSKGLKMLIGGGALVLIALASHDTPPDSDSAYAAQRIEGAFEKPRDPRRPVPTPVRTVRIDPNAKAVTSDPETSAAMAEDHEPEDSANEPAPECDRAHFSGENWRGVFAAAVESRQEEVNKGLKEWGMMPLFMRVGPTRIGVEPTPSGEHACAFDMSAKVEFASSWIFDLRNAKTPIVLESYAVLRAIYEDGNWVGSADDVVLDIGPLAEYQAAADAKFEELSQRSEAEIWLKRGRR